MTNQSILNCLAITALLLGAACDSESIAPHAAHPADDVAVQLRFATQPSAWYYSDDPLTPQITVEAKLASGATAVGFNGEITLTLQSNGKATLSGTTTVRAVRGVALFTDLHVAEIGTGYILQATAAGLSGATSTAFDVVRYAAQLEFVTPPIGSYFTENLTPITVEARLTSGARAFGFTGEISLALAANTMNASLGGTTTVRALAGRATFSDLRITKPGSGYTLLASSSGLTSVSSAPFDVVAAVATGLDVIFTYCAAWDMSELNCIDHRLARVGADGLSERAFPAGSAFDIALSRDGSRIAFASDRHCISADTACGSEIYVMNADGTGVRRITNDPMLFHYAPAWSPDGERIAFTTYDRDPDPGKPRIRLMNADGSAITLLVDMDATGPAWSPDGQKIAFSSFRDGTSNIYVIDFGGHVLTRVTDGAGDGHSPAWSPDGRIAFTRVWRSADGSYQCQVFTMNADGSDPAP